jgi:hypothetical protein
MTEPNQPVSLGLLGPLGKQHEGQFVVQPSDISEDLMNLNWEIDIPASPQQRA